eukprot:3912532-Amphidinium_carterae.1
MHIRLCLLSLVAFVGQTWTPSVDQVRGTMAENSDQELPDFDGDLEDCSSQFNNLVLSEPEAGMGTNLHAVNVEEIPSDDGVPKIWIDLPCKTEEDTKAIESAALVGSGKVDAAHNKGEEKVEQPVEGEHSAKPEAKDETPGDPDGVERELTRETPLATEVADTDMAVAPDQLQTEETAEPAPVTGQALEPAAGENPADQRRYEDDGRIHLGMALQDIICDSKSMKDVLTVAAARVGQINAETARAKMELRKALSKGAEQAWISLWHLVFRSKRVQTQSVKVLVKAHRTESSWSHWDLNEAFFHAFHSMQSALASLTAIWEE